MINRAVALAHGKVKIGMRDVIVDIDEGELMSIECWKIDRTQAGNSRSTETFRTSANLAFEHSQRVSTCPPSTLSSSGTAIGT